MIEHWRDHFTTACNEPRVVRVFFKALVVFTGIKMLLIWTVTRSMVLHHSPTLLRTTLGRIALAPAYFAYDHPDLFFTIAICALIAIFFIRPNYVSTVLFFWLNINLYATNLPIANGSDVVLFMFSLWCIPMVSSQKADERNLTIAQRVAFNLAVLFCQIQIVFLYFVSGWDKLFNANWRTGEALVYIQHLEILYNPVLPNVLISPVANAVLAWATILFELLFPLLVWREKTRLIMLACGTIFHVFIWVVLSLPDFAGIMILSYLIFLKDEDMERMSRFRIRRSLP